MNNDEELIAKWNLFATQLDERKFDPYMPLVINIFYDYEGFVPSSPFNTFISNVKPKVCSIYIRLPTAPSRKLIHLEREIAKKLQLIANHHKFTINLNTPRKIYHRLQVLNQVPIDHFTLSEERFGTHHNIIRIPLDQCKVNFYHIDRYCQLFNFFNSPTKYNVKTVLFNLIDNYQCLKCKRYERRFQNLRHLFYFLIHRKNPAPNLLIPIRNYGVYELSQTFIILIFYGLKPASPWYNFLLTDLYDPRLLSLIWSFSYPEPIRPQ